MSQGQPRWFHQNSPGHDRHDPRKYTTHPNELNNSLANEAPARWTVFSGTWSLDIRRPEKMVDGPTLRIQWIAGQRCKMYACCPFTIRDSYENSGHDRYQPVSTRPRQKKRRWAKPAAAMFLFWKMKNMVDASGASHNQPIPAKKPGQNQGTRGTMQHFSDFKTCNSCNSPWYNNYKTYWC